MSEQKKSGSRRVLGMAAGLALAAGIVLGVQGGAQAAPLGTGVSESIQAVDPAVAQKPGLRLRTISTTRLHARGSAGSKVLLRIPKSTEFKPKAAQPLDARWYKVTFRGKTGYVSRKYVTTVAAKSTAFSGQNPQAPAKYELGYIVNKDHRLSPGYKPALQTIPGTSIRLAPEAVAAYTKMRTAAKKEKISLAAVSGYRSYARQKAVFAAWSRKLGVKQASRVSARPGTSEHQTGLALDVGAANGRCTLATCFANTREGKWLSKNAHRFGFIMRYPKGAEKATGYDFEPWHYRYVGTTIARDMKTKKIKALEQYYAK